MKLILTHPNADFDAIAASLAASKLNPDAIPLVPERTNQNVHHFLTLYRSGLPFAFQRDFQSKAVDHVILVDTQRLPGGYALRKNVAVEIIDHHHPFERDDLAENETFTSEQVGAATTLLVERIQKQNIRLKPIEATLMALGIYEDTGSLSYGTTTPRDILAAAWLLENGAVLDTVRRFLTPPLNDEQQTLYEKLMTALETRVIQGQTIIVSTAAVDEHIPEISSVVHRLRDALDPAALFVLVQMPNSLLLVCRSTGRALDVSQIASLYGGGGHERAAAATIYDRSLEDVAEKLWPQIQERVRPVSRVADLMSFGVQTLDAGQTASEIAQQVRRIGHEGFPVVEDSQVVGLLTRRELDRALEHNLGSLKLRDIMTAGRISLRLDDSVQKLEQTMVDSGWGQIPILDSEDRIIGIVTRTDLINHWANIHPERTAAPPHISDKQIYDVMGEPVATLIDLVASEARASQLNVYLVGGVVRDLLLNRPNLDIDFVVESSAIQFARHLKTNYGGDLHVYTPFGTAKWLLDTTAAEHIGYKLETLPDHIDFATARNEFYEHPTALPTVYQSSIKLDLQRRDFTINTLAVQVSPENLSGRILDFYGGLNDLNNRLIRVIHSLSFVDDPTRILRALRFEHRLGFTIEPRTAELISTALPMLHRTTGDRIRSEFDSLLHEEQPAPALLRMQEMGILKAVHPDFQLPDDLADKLTAANTIKVSWLETAPDQVRLYWHILVTAIPPSQLPEFCERMMFGRKFSASLIAGVRLLNNAKALAKLDAKPSQLIEHLENIPETALLTVWLLTNNRLIRDRIDQFMRTWRNIHAATTGHDLAALGLKPGPCYRIILTRLRNARLDGDITSDTEEQALLQSMLKDEALCDDRT